MLHKKLVIGVMDPDSPLNRAHQFERQAERMLLSGHHEKAAAFYKNAAENLEAAIRQTENPAALLSLRLQVENLRKQPQIVKKRQQWGERKQDLVLTWNKTNPQHVNGHITEGEIPKKLSDVRGPNETGVEERERVDSTESRFDSSEEADSLLFLIRQHVDQKDEKPRYRLAQLLEAFKTLSLGKQDLDSPPNNHSAENQQQSSEQTVRATLMGQNKELQNHLVQLFQVLDSCERENDKLKETVQELSRQLEDCKEHHVSRENHFGIPSESRLDAPFSLIDGFACTPPSESLPPLAPLDVPNFDNVEDMN